MRPWPKGKPLSKAHKRKISQALTGKTIPPAVREKISKALTGKTLPPEVRKKISQKKKGKTRPPFSAEHRRKISQAQMGKRVGGKNPMYGKTHTALTRQKMSQAKKGKKRPQIVGTKISQGLKLYYAKLRYGLALSFRERGLGIALQPVRDTDRYEKVVTTQATRKISNRQLYQAINKLKSLERRIIELRFGLRGAEKDWNEIARITKKRTPEIKSVYLTALRKLRRELERI